MDIENAKKLIRLSLPHMEAYKKDLLFHDMQFMLQKPGTEFLHFTRETGTDIVELIKHSEYPENGKRVKYLFAMANRDHILSEVRHRVEWHAKSGTCKQVLYYDGKGLKAIDMQKAFDIVRAYTTSIRHQWRRKPD